MSSPEVVCMAAGVAAIGALAYSRNRTLGNVRDSMYGSNTHGPSNRDLADVVSARKVQMEDSVEITDPFDGKFEAPSDADYSTSRTAPKRGISDPVVRDAMRVVKAGFPTESNGSRDLGITKLDRLLKGCGKEVAQPIVSSLPMNAPQALVDAFYRQKGLSYTE